MTLYLKRSRTGLVSLKYMSSKSVLHTCCHTCLNLHPAPREGDLGDLSTELPKRFMSMLLGGYERKLRLPRLLQTAGAAGWLHAAVQL